MPFNEKITIVSEKHLPVSNFVRLYQNKLRYFGDLRNQLVHGFRLENKHYLLVSDHAVHEIQTMYEELRDPTPVAKAFGRDVYTCKMSDMLRDVIIIMKEELNTHVPVYNDDGQFVEMISESTIAYWLADQIGDDGEVHLEQVRIVDVHLENTNDLFVFVDKNMSIYQIEALFAENVQAKKRLWAVFVTENGDADEEIIGIVTWMDIPKLSDYFIF